MELENIYELADNKEWQSIIEKIERLPKIDITFDLRCQLARAYNNLKDFEEALKILNSVSEEGKNNAFWNYVMGYSYFHLEDYKLALQHFTKSYSLGNKDVKKWIDWCEEYISNNEIEIKQIANQYKKFGFNISCITNQNNQFNTNSRSYYKTPSHPWINLFTSKQNKFDYEDYDWENCVGVGTFTNWNNLVVIDVDGWTNLTI